jgi:hypothetical protein
MPWQKIFTVDPPDQRTEKVESYYAYVPKLLLAQFGTSPSRTTLLKWIANGKGYPIVRGGPYLALPIFRRLKKPMTTQQAMSRWLTTLAHLEEEEGLR